ncbi:hypothetical protein QBC47DRAFT_383940 [Echria macrotheca]|uniref:Thioredoxin domain-containing protein n=1 Tax=Echria macrotheca TaxID=438768 RepID=A0AAJ0BBW3_9PEZI|nr:hypothetical protein QBC47DRAFT_383940 [Echria macrotheca]
MAVKNLTTLETLDKILHEKDHLAVVYCYKSKTDAEAMRFPLQEWSVLYNEAAYYYLDMDSARPVADELGIDNNEPPHFLIFRDGRKIGSVTADAAHESAVDKAEAEIREFLGRRDPALYD